MSDLLNTIRQELNALTMLRRRVVKENDLVGRLFADLRQDKAIPPSWDDLRVTEEKAQALAPGFYVHYSVEDDSYVLLPKTDKELTEEV